jgi:nucleoside-diphosphate-sugar epimerase
VKVLVVGASGLVGSAALAAFGAAGVEVVAASRRRPELDAQAAAQLEHLALDLRDADACATALSARTDITHLVYAAVHELPGLVAGWKDREQMAVNEAMLRNVLVPLLRAGGLEHVTLLQGTKAYGVHHHPIRVPARESEPRDPHENFYWLQEDMVRALATKAGFEWTIFRPPLIVGPNHGVAMNLVPVIAAYAMLRASDGLPFAYPGGPSYVAEAVDVRLLADAFVWAATSPAAWGQHFNITNGEVFQWRDLWGSFAEVLGVEPGADEPQSVVSYLEARAGQWDRIVAAHGLRPVALAEFVGQSHHYADFQFAYRARTPPPPALMSTVKLHQAGFHQVWDTEMSFRHWFRVLAARGFIPERVETLGTLRP